ncbi:MAG: RluA family pseudouridine synthase [Candidatus Aminicenantes bacterium]
MPKKEFLIPSSGADQRLDLFVSSCIQELSRSRIQKLIEKGDIKVNGQIKKSSYKLRAEDRVEAEYDLYPAQEIEPENIPLHVVHQDQHILIIDKPSGMVVHPGAGKKSGTLVNALLYNFPDLQDIGAEERPGIVHRLDKETSGLMVVAHSIKAFHSLQQQFKGRKVEKLYLGLIWGKMPDRKGEISWSVGRHPKYGQRVSIKTKKPRPAHTRYAVLEEYTESSLLEIKPITGRTHQIRVHFASAGHPVVGDTRYGGKKARFKIPRLFLHACGLSFFHPETGKRVKFSSPLPEELKDFLKQKIKH